MVSTSLCFKRHLVPASVLSVVLAVAGLAACGAPPSNKTELKICTAGKDGCPSESDDTAKKKAATDTSTTSDNSSPPPSSPAAAPPPATGAPALPPAKPATPASDGGLANNVPADLGPSCTRLKGCCEAFVAVGIFSDFCYEALDTGVEATCDDKYQSYIADPENTACF